ncbi:MAG: hypothetical protein DHS20C18_04860 [Saprospiraceae bacterium]|nr:MAG: hypothetical protein DHS20C18_04860 [Saprospiraceae bacterium]
MDRLLTCFLSGIALLALLTMTCCNRSIDLYSRSYSTVEQQKLAQQFLAGVGTYYYQGSPQEIFLIKEGLKYNPNSASLWREFGAPTIKRGFARASYIYYGKAVDLDPLEWQGWRGYLYLYFYRDYQRALADFNATDTLTPNFIDYPQSTSVDFMRGICYLQLGEYDQALTFFEQHIEAEIGMVGEAYIDSRVFLFEGIAYFKLDKLDQAIKSFNRGLRVHEEKNADLWYWLAKSLMKKGQLSLAATALERAEEMYKRGYFHERSYVEEFYETYPAMIANLQEELVRIESNK